MHANLMPQIWFEKAFGAIFVLLTSTDEEPVDMDVLLNEFNTDNCPGLENKEKMFLVQACRGSELGNYLFSEFHT